MAIHAPKPEDREWEIPDEGLYRAVCCDTVLKLQVDTKFGVKDQLQVRWQLDPVEAGRTEVKDKDGNVTEKPFMVMKSYNLSVNKKATLRKDVESWRGRRFASDEEAAEFDFEKLVGQNCQLTVVHNKSQDGERTYANVQTVVPAPKGLEPLVVEGYTRVTDRTEDDGIPF